jgi:hypothetical protein
MKKNLFFLFATSLFLAFTPAENVSIENANAQTLKAIVHSFHVVTTGSDQVSYYVTLDFNLSTQLFGVITAHAESDPYNELDCTLDTGSGTTLGGNGSTIETTGVSISIDNTSITIDIPDDTYTFDY